MHMDHFTEAHMIKRLSLCTLLAGTLTPAVTVQPCSGQPVETVAGIGGVFFRARDPQALAAWYEAHLGIARVPSNYDTQPWMQLAGPTVFAPFLSTTDYFGRPEQQWMLNFRVRALDAMVQQLRSAGIEVKVDTTAHPNGRFARLHDPEGNPIELWQPTLMIATALPSPAASQDSARVTRVRAELERLYDLNAAAYMRGDLSAVMALRSEGFHAIPANGVLQDRAAMENYMQGIMNGIRKWNQMTFMIDSLTVVGDTAIAVVWQFLDRMGLRPDNQVHHVHTWVTQRETWVYQGDRWLMWRVDQLRNQRRLVDGRPG
jgi:predicted enzyme related to lactoylglutathione lyase/ketosteroid isomerase-like protein